MPQEPKSFFERITGARLLGSSGKGEKIQYEDNYEQDVNVEPQALPDQELDDAIEFNLALVIGPT